MTSMTPMTTALTLNETVLKNARPEVAVWLAEFVVRNGGFVGSVHLTEPAEREGEIVLVAAHNLPPSVQNGTATIPFGKGMAGTAAERREPVAISDFQADTTGVAVPGAVPRSREARSPCLSTPRTRTRNPSPWSVWASRSPATSPRTSWRHTGRTRRRS